MKQGQAVVDAVIRANAIQTAVAAEDGVILLWQANAVEQIEAALSEMGLKITRKDLLSAKQVSMLKKISNYGDPFNGVEGMSARGGTVKCVKALLRRKLVVYNGRFWELTDMGKEKLQ